MFKFKCPDCGNNELLSVAHDVTVVTEVIGLMPDGKNLEFGKIIETEDGHPAYLYCGRCGLQFIPGSWDNVAHQLKERGFYVDDSTM